METWKAFHVAWSNGVYFGRRVSFTHEGRLVEGTLGASGDSSEGGTLLRVGGEWFVVAESTPITIHPAVKP